MEHDWPIILVPLAWPATVSSTLDFATLTPNFAMSTPYDDTFDPVFGSLTPNFALLTVKGLGGANSDVFRKSG